MPKNGDSGPTIVRVAGGNPRGIPLTVTLKTAISVPAQIVNGDASMGQQLVQKWCNDCHAVGAGDAEAYGSVPSFVLIAEKRFSIGGLNWYSRRSTVPGLRCGKQELAAGTLLYSGGGGQALSG